jgi:hypothetical protein
VSVRERLGLVEVVDAALYTRESVSRCSDVLPAAAIVRAAQRR